MAAAHKNHLATAEALVNRGADMQAKDNVCEIVIRIQQNVPRIYEYVEWKHVVDICCRWWFFIPCELLDGERS